jgi:hypothetical protein
MHFRRWLDIKGCLEQNGYFTEKKRAEEGYDPIQKYRFVWYVMTHNMIQLIERGGLDLTIDKTSWPNSSYANVRGRLNGKKTDKGGQHVLLLDSQRCYLHAWTPCYKLFEIKAPFTAMSPAEVVCLMDIIKPLIKGAPKEPDDKRRQIFEEHVHVAMDNFFSGDKILRFIGEGGWKAIMTCRRNRLPKEVPKMYFNFLKATSVNTRSKVARFEQPIIAVKNIIQPRKKVTNDDDDVPGIRASTNKDNEPLSDKKKDYVICHVSVQSTGGTNITSVNALSLVELYVREQNKGRGSQNREPGELR